VYYTYTAEMDEEQVKEACKQFVAAPSQANVTVVLNGNEAFVAITWGHCDEESE